MAETKDPPPARELPAIQLDEAKEWPAMVLDENRDHSQYDDEWRRMTTADLAACLAALPEAERAELLASYMTAANEALRAEADSHLATAKLHGDYESRLEQRATQAEAKLERLLVVARAAEVVIDATDPWFPAGHGMRELVDAVHANRGTSPKPKPETKPHV